MSTPTDGTVPAFSNPADYAKVRARLADADFTGRGITSRLAVDAVPTTGVLNHPLHLWRTRGGDPLDTFIRLFLLYSVVPADTARAAVAPMPLETWVEAGVLRRADMSDGGGEGVAANVRMLPYAGLVLATDQPPRTEAEVRPDFVMSVGAATITLANATVRRPARRTLDLGCGCGTLGLLAAGHSEEVYCLDRNSRAVAYTKFNALLNGLENVKALEGNWFEPVESLRGGFDLIVCNPPFVISPEARYLYRDSGMRGDEICRTIARQAPAFLAEGGYHQMLCNWAHVAGEDWRQGLASWFGGSGCDAWVLRSETHDAATYADTWTRQAGQRDAAETDRVFGRWMEYYRVEGIESVSAGLVTMRRTSGRRNWVRIEDGPKKTVVPIGDEIAAGFVVRDVVELADDAALLATRLRAAPDLRLEEHAEVQQGGWRVLQATLGRSGGLGNRGSADPSVAGLVGACTGDRPLGQVVQELAGRMGRPADEVAPAVARIVRQLMLEGFLAPAVTSP